MHQHMQDLSTTDSTFSYLFCYDMSVGDPNILNPFKPVLVQIRAKVAHDCKYKEKCLTVQGYIGAAWADKNRCAVWISFNNHAKDHKMFS